MGFNKNFVVKNGLEVNNNLIFADAVTSKVGIATSNPTAELDVEGAINAADISVTGVGTFPSVDVTTAHVDTGYINVGVITNISGTTLNYTGDGTLGSLLIGANSVINSSRQLQNIDSLDATTKQTIESTVDLSIGIQTGGTDVGYGVTLIDFRGPGVSTGFYNTTSGIATIFFQGGGGSGAGAIGIGSTFPGSPYSTADAPSNGDLFYHIDYGRTFIYYDEAALGVGISTYWVDSSPYNLNGDILEKTGDSMLGGLGIVTGTASSPGLFFSNSTSTGLFSPSEGEASIVSVGNTILTANPDGAVVSGVLTASNLSSTNFSSGIITATNKIHLGSTGAGGTVTSSGHATLAGVVTASGFSGPIYIEESVDNSAFYNITFTRTEFDGSDIVGDKYDGLTIDSGGLGFNPGTNSLTVASAGVGGSTITISGYNGTFSGHIIQATHAKFTGIVTAADFNSTSDEILKENITTVENAVDLNNQLRGVRFEWKKDGRPSYGVIAQELEQVLPELVSDTDPKTVNYNGIIGVLIEAVKELSERVDELENR